MGTSCVTMAPLAEARRCVIQLFMAILLKVRNHLEERRRCSTNSVVEFIRLSRLCHNNRTKVLWGALGLPAGRAFFLGQSYPAADLLSLLEVSSAALGSWVLPGTRKPRVGYPRFPSIGEIF